MPQKPHVRRKHKRRATKKLAEWRAKQADKDTAAPKKRARAAKPKTE